MDNTFKEESYGNPEDMRTRALLFFLHKNRRKLNEEYDPKIEFGKGVKVIAKEGDKEKKEEQGKKEKESETQNTQPQPQNQNQNEKADFKLKMFVTEICAVCPIDGKVKYFSGPYISAKSIEDATWMLQNTGLGYCKVLGELVGLIDNNGTDVKEAYKLN